MNEKEQIERFKRAAREVEADESSDALERVMDRLDLTRKPEPKAGQDQEAKDGDGD